MSKTTSPTPGDWQVNQAGGETAIVSTLPDGRRQLICMGMFDEEIDPSIKEVDANARIMAASKDLEAAAQAARIALTMAYGSDKAALFVRFPDLEPVYQQLDAAIRKAKGSA